MSGSKLDRADWNLEERRYYRSLQYLWKGKEDAEPTLKKHWKNHGGRTCTNPWIY